MRFIDTHTHLYEPDYGDENVVERAVEAGVTKLVLPDVSSASRADMFALAERHEGIAFPCLGLHPTEVDENWEKELDLLFSQKDKKVCAIGETGLDCHWSKDFLKQQIEVFRLQLELAIEKNLPVIIHSREATALCLETLSDYRGRGLRGVMHAYGGSIETFRELEKLGEWYVGIGGVLTFKKASIAETVKDIPLEKILLETDAPWLTPVPFRGSRNESAYIPYIARKLAEIKNIDEETVADVTTASAENLFSI